MKVTEKLVLLLIKMTARTDPTIYRESAERLGSSIARALSIAQGPDTEFTKERIAACIERWRSEGSLPPQMLH